ncbi:MAG: MerR family transcriptional regulator [Chitinophagaceae bacterium]|nr:MAG: MerR family transcriptional regulator [Chitinophagaceae bacterium]
MPDEQFQFAFDFFGEPEKPGQKPGEPAVPGAAGGPERPADAPDAAPAGDTPAPDAPFDFSFVYDDPAPPPVGAEPFPDPLAPQPASGLSEYLSGAPAEPAPEKAKSKRGRKSQKAMAEEVGLVQVPPDEELLKKQYYGIREVSEMFAVNASLLRYWEAAFGLQLRKNRKGDRFFTPQDIKTVQLIHDLLRRRKFTIDGARDFLKRNKGADQRYELIQSLQRVRKFLLELKAHM